MCETCNDTGAVYTAGQVTVECECVDARRAQEIAQCDANDNSNPPDDPDHHEDPLARPSTYLGDIPLSTARAAHAGTSFVPERRGDQEVQSYANTLASDYRSLLALARTDELAALLRESFARYRQGYRNRYVGMLIAKSRTMSTMITGGSNFPVRRQRKLGASADKRTEDVVDYRERVLAAIRRDLRPELRPVMAGDDDAVTRLREKIAKAEDFQAKAKVVNATIRKHAKGGTEAQVQALMALGFNEARARNALVPDMLGRVGIADYELKNNNANIRRMKERLEQITAAKATPSTEVKGERATLEDCPADNRVRLFYPGKPDADTRTRLKAGGFRWAPSIGCWQAYRNDRSLRLANREAGIETAP